MEIKFIAAITSPEGKGNPRNPERGMVRHQFLEVLVRIAEEKYLKYKIVDNYE